MKRFLLGLAAVLLLIVGSLLQTPANATTEIAGVWTEFHAPVAATQATVTRAAVTGKRHILNCLAAHLVAGSTAPAAFQTQVVVRDGATGVGTIIWSAPIAIPATAGAVGGDHEMCGLAIAGTAGNAMTIEMVAAGGANTFEAVFMQGRDDN